MSPFWDVLCLSESAEEHPSSSNPFNINPARFSDPFSRPESQPRDKSPPAFLFFRDKSGENSSLSLIFLSLTLASNFLPSKNSLSSRNFSFCIPFSEQEKSDLEKIILSFS